MTIRRGRAVRVAASVIGVVFALLVAAGALLVIFEGRLVYFPDRVIYATPDTIGLEYRNVRFTAADGVELDGWYVPAKRARAIVIVCHGNAGNISTRIPLLRGLHRTGLSSFIFDYQGYGRSGGSPSERGTYLDSEAAWHWVATHVDGAGSGRLPIVIMGRSLGGPIAASLAAHHPPGALVLDSTFPSLRSLVHERAPFLPARLLLRFRYDTAAFLKQINCPVLVVHSRNDSIVPIRQGVKLFAAISGPKEFLELSGPHVGGFVVSPQHYSRTLRQFLADHVFAGDARPPLR